MPDENANITVAVSIAATTQTDGQVDLNELDRLGEQAIREMNRQRTADGDIPELVYRRTEVRMVPSPDRPESPLPPVVVAHRPDTELVEAAATDVFIEDLVLETIAEQQGNPDTYRLAAFCEALGIDSLFWEIEARLLDDGRAVRDGENLELSDEEMDRMIRIFRERVDARKATR